MSSNVHVILNPAASSGGGRRLLPRLEDALAARNIEFRLHRTRGPGHAAELARRAVADGCDRLVVAGGDGTIHEVANGLLEGEGTRRVPIAVVPVGTGNDFYRMVGGSRSLDAALDVLEHGSVRSFDVGLARWEGGEARFVNFMGLGVDVEVLHRREGFRRLPGMVQYLAAILTAVARFEPYPVRVRLPDEEFLDRTHLCAVTVGPSVAGGFLLCPGALPDDGLLDMCFVEALRWDQVARHLPKLLRGTHTGLDVVRMRRTGSIRIEDPDRRPFPFQLDGELMPDSSPWLEGSIEPGRLPVLVREGTPG